VDQQRGRWWRAAAAGLLIASLAAPAHAGEWWERKNPVWQDHDEIYAVARGRTQREAEEHARQALVGALRTSLPGIDADLAGHSAATDKVEQTGEKVAVRLVFPADVGEACNRGETWFAEGQEHRAAGALNRALEAFAQAAWRTPGDPEIADRLATVLADYGLWYAAADLLDAAEGRWREPPVTMLRNRVTIHIWMENRTAAERALEALRRYDPADPEIQTLEAMLRAIRESRRIPTEKVVMIATAQSLDAELAAVFAGWNWDRPEQREARVATELDRGDVPDELTLGSLRFEGLRGWWDDEREILSVEDRLSTTWRVTVDDVEGGGSALAHAGRYEPPEKLVRENHPIQLGGAFPLHPRADVVKIDEAWIRPMYYSVERQIPDRLRLVLFVRSGDQVTRILVDGPMGLSRDSRPGLPSAPVVAEMLLTTMRPALVEKP